MSGLVACVTLVKSWSRVMRRQEREGSRTSEGKLSRPCPTFSATVDTQLTIHPGKPRTQGHGRHAWNQKDAQIGYITLKVVIPSDPVITSFHFRIYVYIQLIVNKLGIFKCVTSHSHMITNINCKCSLNMHPAHYSTNLLHSTCKITLQT